MSVKSIKVPQHLTRAAKAMGVVDEAGRTVRMSISSDEPYLRYDYWNDEEYWEVLDHGPGGIDDERLKGGLPILFNHNREKHLGRGVSFEVDGHKCEVVAKFSESPFAEEKFRDVKAGILVDTSVGYELLGEGICIGAKEEKPIYKFRFKVYEGSLVTIPADGSVGVGRQRDNKPTEPPREIAIKEIDNTNNSDNTTKTEPPTNQSQMKLSKFARQHFEANKDEGGAPSEAVLEKAAKDAVAAHKSRCKKIDEYVKALGEVHKNLNWQKKAAAIAEKHKDGDANFEEFRAEANTAFVAPGEVDAEDTDGGSKRNSEMNFEILTPGNRRGSAPRLSIGAQFVQSKQFQKSPRGCAVTTDVRGVGIRGKVELASRAGFTSSDLSAINVAPMQNLIQLGVQRLTLMDVIAPGTTSAAAIPYPKENSMGTVDGVAVAAGAVPRVGTTAERGRKPKWEPDLTTDVANVSKIAVTTPVPEEFLSDFPGFQSYIDERGPWMVDIETEIEMLYGDGLGTNLKGILTHAGIQTRDYATSWAETIKKGITDVQVGSFFEPDFIAWHPYDWEVAKLEKDENDQFICGGPVFVPYGNGLMVRIESYWGIPCVITTSVAVGRPVIGAGKLGAQYFIREGMRVETSNSNNDDFERNMLTLRFEHRLALATYRPPAFLEIIGGPART